MTCPTCRKAFQNTVKARVFTEPAEGRRFLIIPLPDAEDWSLPDAALHMNVGVAKTLRGTLEGMESLAAIAGASKDKRGLLMFKTIATWISGVLEYTEPEDLTSQRRIIDKWRNLKEKP